MFLKEFLEGLQQKLRKLNIGVDTIFTLVQAQTEERGG